MRSTTTRTTTRRCSTRWGSCASPEVCPLVPPLFHEEQSYRQPRVRLLLAIPPVILLAVTIWQVGLGHRWRAHGPSSGDMVTMTVFIWLVYVYLLRVRL